MSRIDEIERPIWYANVDGIECKDINGELNYNLGCAVKYIWRAGHKDDRIKDYKKAVQYLRFEAERMSKLSYFQHMNNKIHNHIIKKLIDSDMEAYKKYMVLMTIKANNTFSKRKYLKIIWEMIFSLSIEIGEIKEVKCFV